MALSKIQVTVLEELSNSPLKEKFYWTGGTLLAEKYLHHRDSYDVDLFTDDPFGYEEVLPLVASVKKTTNVKVVEEHKVFDRWEFFLHNHREVRFEFVHYQFPKLKPRKIWRGVLIDSLEDLAANKIMASFERHEPKDFFDLYFIMLRKKWKFSKLLQFAQKKFGLQISEPVVLGEILRGCQRLEQIKIMFHGTEIQRDNLIKKINQHFELLSANAVRSAMK